jgi:hypothetical protein
MCWELDASSKMLPKDYGSGPTHVIKDFKSGLVKEYLRNYGLDYYKYTMISMVLNGDGWQSLDSISLKAPSGGI